jgi:hypothetical protein
MCLSRSDAIVKYIVTRASISTTQATRQEAPLVEGIWGALGDLVAPKLLVSLLFRLTLFQHSHYDSPK